MKNHYHILLETPEASLVVGMKWFQGTYTQRFNASGGISFRLDIGHCWWIMALVWYIRSKPTVSIERKEQ
ncbi:hypothetical protein [Candidatus Scalindua japonica]|uniref:hypothetical protein n=1 Tax=Candidatus Scalindua japonica TaxID=1284222 RepID=UPI000BDE69BA